MTQPIDNEMILGTGLIVGFLVGLVGTSAIVAVFTVVRRLFR